VRWFLLLFSFYLNVFIENLYNIKTITSEYDFKNYFCILSIFHNLSDDISDFVVE